MKLKDYRKLRGLTLEQASEELKVSAGTVSRWENGTIPKPCEMVKIKRWSNGAVMPNDFYEEVVS